MALEMASLGDATTTERTFCAASLSCRRDLGAPPKLAPQFELIIDVVRVLRALSRSSEGLETVEYQLVIGRCRSSHESTLDQAVVSPDRQLGHVVRALLLGIPSLDPKYHNELEKSISSYALQRLAEGGDQRLAGLARLQVTAKVTLVKEITCDADVAVIDPNTTVTDGDRTASLAPTSEDGSFDQEAGLWDECEDESNCTVCMESFTFSERMVRLPCSHAFHKECIIRWMTMHNSCPLCRSGINLSRELGKC